MNNVISSSSVTVSGTQIRDLFQNILNGISLVSEANHVATQELGNVFSCLVCGNLHKKGDNHRIYRQEQVLDGEGNPTGKYQDHRDGPWVHWEIGKNCGFQLEKFLSDYQRPIL